MSKQDKPTSVADTLRRARALIAEPDRWVKGVYATSDPTEPEEHEVPLDSPRAVAWCAIGAVRRVDGPYEQLALEALADAIAPDRRWSYTPTTTTIYQFNDASRRKHTGLLQKFDRAIKAAEKAQP